MNNRGKQIYKEERKRILKEYKVMMEEFHKSMKKVFAEIDKELEEETNV